ncbi:Bestrophin, RFP-TM, chloride channel-domain-containing protein [Crucibulum laeve]|uniref:Bestrophin, RFP-TM, chloride channel-domain-containing protein n=1 Tax=Crucibulum laeve TaxID=68775 RepID=A0A5C3LN88_9AGAR|nr:Bestrophin, RFP-TM, chloride channel-domain-containing protein [Crucibulum laeve]
MWTNISTASRNLAQMITEKGWMILAFAVSLKHLLRGEEGVYYTDLFPLVSCLPRYANIPPTIPTEADILPLWWTHGAEAGYPHSDGSSMIDSEKVPLAKDLEDTTPKPAKNPLIWKTTIYDHIALLRFLRWCILKTFQLPPPRETKGPKGQITGLVGSHVPLEIWLVLSNYSGWLMKKKLLEPAIATGMTNNLTVLQDTLSNLETICNTPLPFEYRIHLRISLWLYLFFLPWQIYSSFKYATIPATAFVSFLLIGFLEIGQQIENPFNYGLNDLELDHFCFAIQRDLHEITTHIMREPSELFNAWNRPFSPADQRNAAELTNLEGKYTRPSDSRLGEPGIDSIRRTLMQGWREVDVQTRSNDY